MAFVALKSGATSPYHVVRFGKQSFTYSKMKRYQTGLSCCKCRCLSRRCDVMPTVCWPLARGRKGPWEPHARFSRWGQFRDARSGCETSSLGQFCPGEGGGNFLGHVQKYILERRWDTEQSVSCRLWGVFNKLRWCSSVPGYFLTEVSVVTHDKCNARNKGAGTS